MCSSSTTRRSGATVEDTNPGTHMTAQYGYPDGGRAGRRLLGGYVWDTCGSRHQLDKERTLPALYGEALVVSDQDSYTVVNSDSTL